MPNYDLSMADLGRVANQSVDMLRIANQIVWQTTQSPVMPTFSIFDEASIALSSHVDLHENAYVANQFHRSVGSAYEIVDVGIYVPAGSSLIGRTGSIGVMLNNAPYTPNTVYPNNMAILGGPTAAPLVAGWNWHPLPTPVPWEDSKPWVLGGYSIDTHYLFNSTLSENAISSADLEFDLSPTNADGMWRSWFTRPSDGQFVTTSSRSYGIDLRCRVSDNRLLRTFIPPSFNNPGHYNYGFRFSRTTAFTAIGAYWYHRVTDGPLVLTPRLYNPNTEAVLNSNSALSTSGFPDQQWVKIPFSAPYSGLADTDYVLSVEADGTASFNSDPILPQSEAGFTLHEGRYTGDAGFPSNTWSGLHGVGLNWTEPD
jgi:hypothetical protein